MLLVMLSGVGWLLQSTNLGQDAEAHVMRAVEEQLSPNLRAQVQTVFDQVRDKAVVGGPIGLLTLLVAAIAVFAQFDAAFDRIWNVPESPGRGIWGSIKHVLFARLKAFLMLFALGAVVLAVFISGMALTQVELLADGRVPWSDWLNWPLQFAATFALNAVTFTLVYRWLPKVEVPWKAALGGGLLAAVIWEIGRQVLAAVVIGQKYSSAYGVVGAFLAIMLWAYYGVSVLLFGAEFAQTLKQRGRKNAD
jgi:membrane protein